MEFIRRLVVFVVGLGIVILGLFWLFQRRLLYFPSHEAQSDASIAAGLTRWQVDGEYTGFARLVANPRRVWLCVHGNGGQAANREGMLRHFSPRDTVYILEYPGYGDRPGSPSREVFDAAALKAYEWLRQTYGDARLIVLGESLGSGPACALATSPHPPRRLVLVVPFDVLADVAQEHFPFLPVKLILRDRWDNVAALAHFAGAVDIFGGTYDQVIPVHHARSLAARHPGAIYHEFAGGHGWWDSEQIDLSAFE